MRKKLHKNLKRINSSKIIIIAIFFSIFLAVGITGLGMAYYEFKIDDIGLSENQSYFDLGRHSPPVMIGSTWPLQMEDGFIMW